MIIRSTLLMASRSRWLRNWVENSPLAKKLTRRFVAGETLEEGLAACARLNQEGIVATLDHLGEDVASAEEVGATRDAYLRALDEIGGRRLGATVSVKLTHFGLDISESTCRRNVTEVVIRAKERGTAVEVDMETSAHVDRTLSLVTNLHREYGCVRAVIQAYLRRSEQDIRMLNGIKVPIRLCKGAYQEPAAIAYPQKSEVDANYRHLAGLLLDSGYYPALATHDERIIREVVEIVRRRGASQANLEFQMLYGIRKSLQRELVRRGFSVRLYVPYGVAWYPYFMRRLAERPANLAFLVKNFLRR